MKTIDLRREQVGLDELLRSVGDEVVRITSKDGAEFVLEAAEAFEREAHELGRSEKFRAFLAERSSEHGGLSIAEIGARLEGPESTNSEPALSDESEQASPFPRRGSAD